MAGGAAHLAANVVDFSMFAVAGEAFTGGWIIELGDGAGAFVIIVQHGDGVGGDIGR